MGIFGKVWKKHSFGVALFCLILLFSSCSNGAENASLTLTFNGADFARTSARNITVDSDYKDYYLVVNILGDYTETKEIPFSEIGTYGVTFLSIPVGAKISVQANVYDMNDEEDDNGQQGTDVRQHFYHIYTGSSPEINIVDGYNIVSLSLKRFDSMFETEDCLINEYNNRYVTYDSYRVSDISDNFYMQFYSNSKYQILSNYEDDFYVISEGTWTGDLSLEGKLYLKECMYIQINLPENIQFEDESIIGLSLGKMEIITEQKSNIMKKEFWNNGNSLRFSFTSQNGLTFIFPQSV